MGKKARKLNREKKGKNSKEFKDEAPIELPFLEKHPNWTAGILLTILLLIFFNQVMFTDKVYIKPDIINAKSSQTFVKEALDSGVYPLWNPNILCGMPSFASLMNAPHIDPTGLIVYGTIDVIKKVIPFSGFIRLFANYVLLGMAIFLAMRLKGSKSGIALFMGVGLVLLPQVVAYSVFGHTSKLASVIFIPLIFIFAERLLEKRNLLYFSLTGLAIGLQLLRAHVQICYYTQLMLGVYFIYWAILTYKSEKKIGRIGQGLGLIAGAIAIGLMLSSVLNLSVLEYAGYSTRGGSASGGLDFAYATNWSLPPAEIVNFIVPSFMGFGGDTYWGAMIFTDFPIYFGLITLFLAGLSLVLNRNRMTIFLTILAGLTLLASFGRHFPILFGPMFKLLPFFNKFRAPKMINIMFSISFIIMAGYGIQGLIEYGERRREDVMRKLKKYSVWFGGVVLFVLLFLLLGKDLYIGWAAERLGNRANLAYNQAANDSIRAVFLFLGAFGLSVLALKKPKFKHLIPFAFILLLCIDVWPISQRFMTPVSNTQQTQVFMESPDVTFLKNQNDVFRVLPFGTQRSGNWYSYHGIQNVFGYNAAKLKIYEDFIPGFTWQGTQNYPKLHLKPDPKNPGRLLPRQAAEVTPALRNMHDAYMKILNIKYVISPLNLYSLDPSLTPVFAPSQNGASGVFEYSGNLGRVFLVDSVMVVKGENTDRAILEYINAGLLDPGNTAIIEESPEFEITPSPDNKVEITDYSIHQIDIKADIKTPSLMVLSEIYYPAGWNAYIDGVKTKIYKTDYLLRSVFLKPGEHKVEFKFEPKMFRLGLIISVVTMIFLIGGIIMGVLINRRKVEK